MISNFISIDNRTSELLEDFYQMHLDAKLNLTSIKDREEFYIKHYLDSIYIFEEKKFEFQTLLDVGSGGGFPGIVLAIFYPNKRITLCESIRKKCDFLSESVKSLGLSNVDIINSRVENIKKRKFDVVTARGVSRLLMMMELTENVSRETTTFIYYKGERLDDELREASKYFKNKKLRAENVRIETPFKRTYAIVNSIGSGMCK